MLQKTTLSLHCNIVAMTGKSLHIVFSFFLLLNFLFSQVGVNFCHHHKTFKENKEQTSIGKKSEECSVCKYKSSQKIFFEDLNSFWTLTQKGIHFILEDYFPVLEIVLNPSSRAPPVL
jgi:hypothetical protein